MVEKMVKATIPNTAAEAHKAAQARKAAVVRRVAVKALSSSGEVDRFSKAAKTFERDATESREKARQTLVGLGIHTASGKLTKHYRSK